MKTSGRSKNRKNGGFTLVELVVILAILAIMAALTTLAVIKWQDWARFKRENEYAQALYLAAQNQLTEYAGTGYLTDFAESMVDPDALDDPDDTDYSDDLLVPHKKVTDLTDGDGSAYTGIEKVWRVLDGSGLDDSEKADYSGRFGTDVVVLKAKAGDILSSDIDIETAHKNKDSEAIQTYWVSRLLRDYVADGEVLANATISIEVAPEDGQVFALLYSDSAGDFKYDNNTGETAGYYNASQRKESYRARFMVGYYGVDTLTKSIYGKPDNNALKLAKVVLRNDDVLDLSFRHSSDTVPVRNIIYDISVYDAELATDNLDLTIKLDMPSVVSSVGGAALTAAKDAGSAIRVKLPVTRYRVDGKSDMAETGTSLGELPFLLWVEDDKRPTIHLVLDAADVQAGTWLYEKDYAAIHSDGYTGVGDFKNTYSYFRFGLNQDNIKCSVKAGAPTYASTSAVYSNSENPAYYEEKYTVLGIPTGIIKKTHRAGTTAFSYKLKNPRHLYNVRYMEDPGLDTVDSVEHYGTDTARSLTFNMMSDLSWSDFTERGALKSSPDTLTRAYINDAEPTAESLKSANFPSIKNLRSRDTFSGYKSAKGFEEEGTYVINNISISKAANGGYMVNIEPFTGDKKEDVPTGLFMENTGTIKDLSMDRAKVEGDDYVGSFVGINAAAVSSLENLTLENTEFETLVKGKSNVGGIVGYEIPTGSDAVISKLTNRGAVQGMNAVGGIVGMVRNSFDITLTTDKYDTKPASITKPAWDAIIADQNNTYVTISDCENTGAVTAPIEDTVGEEDSRYIGGIVGYIYSATEPDVSGKARITLESCYSSPCYEASYIKNDFEKLLKGVYVGGIAGYNHFGGFRGCGSVSGKDGYVFGCRYVGGIVGMNIGPADGTVVEGGAAGDDAMPGVNANNVIGRYYVGGITGVNASASKELSNGVTDNSGFDPLVIENLEDKPVIVPNVKKNVQVSVQKWTNEGVVMAMDEYAGGITGFNAGWIYNCNSDVDVDMAGAVMNDTLETGMYKGDYVGGIAGFNNGIIGCTKRIANPADGTLGKKVDGASSTTLRANVFVTGRNYVGGIVGYNDVDAIVEDYQVAGGSVYGSPDGYFIGGYAGLNVSLAMLMDLEKTTTIDLPGGGTSTGFAPRKVYSNPNEITGGYFVGGNIGGNLVNLKSDDFEITDSEDTRIYGLFETNNFLGQIKDTHEFVGGFVGYNSMYCMDTDRFNKIAPAIVETMSTIDASGMDVRTMLAAKMNLMDDLAKNLTVEGQRLIKDTDTALSTMYITGEDELSVAASNLGRISADVCVGGVIGYNDSDTKLYIKNARNATPVVARYAIENEEEQDGRKKDYSGNDYGFRYSYAGGILGKVEKNTTIDNCSNTSSGSVTSDGTYRGAIAEINEGLIINCNVGNFGSVGFEYVGGIVGLNDYIKDDDHYGEVRDCTIDSRTVTGKNVVGGIAAENRGLIYNIKVNRAAVTSQSTTRDSEQYGVAGVYAGVNCEEGRIYVADVLKDINVTSKGSCAGGIAGINRGFITPDTESIKKLTGKDIGADEPVLITGKVHAYKDAGGVMGLNESKIKIEGETPAISYFCNEADITATNGNAGGIVGNNKSRNIISYCMNKGVVNASNEGNAGGITALNLSRIEYCSNVGEVRANEGLAGGIVARNDVDDDEDIVGKVFRCGVYSPEFVEHFGKGDNKYVIGTMYYDDDEYNESNEDLDTPGAVKEIEPLEFVSKTCAGAVAAVNHGNIEECEARYVTVSNHSDSRKESCIGIFAGRNEIKKKSDVKPRITLAEGQSTEACSLTVKVNHTYAGGVAGLNEGRITGTYDGVTGIPLSVVYVEAEFDGATTSDLGGAAALNKGTIEGVGVKGIIEGSMGSASIGVGGIAGVNGSVKNDKEKALITNCSFDGTVKAKGAGAGVARLGGIAGINGTGSGIESCFIGVLNDKVNLDRETGMKSFTKIYAGEVEKDSGVLTTDTTVEYNKNNVDGLRIESIRTPSDTSSYAFVGGIAGENYGLVTQCDNYLKSTDKVEITTFTAVVGGIVGYNYDGALVAGKKDVHTSTGDDWAIEARGADNDLGNGGIIGINSSGENLKYLDNYADVSCRFYTNTSTGGIVGFVNQKKNTTFTISDCRNYGDIVTNYRAGGMVGLIMYNTFNFVDCINYGTVRSMANKAGGFLQYWANSDVDASATGCFNHGDVYALDSGCGFFADSGGTIYMSDCVNTGNIYKVKGTGANDGLVAENTSNSAFGYSGTVHCDFCRDYSNNKTFSFGASTATLTNSLGNRFYPALTTSSMDDYRGTFMPIARKVTGNVVRNNYYVGFKGDESSEDGGLYFAMSPDAALRNDAYNNKATDYLAAPVTDNAFVTQVGSTGGKAVYTFDIDQSSSHKDMKYFIMYLYNFDFSSNTNTKVYDIKADVTASGGNFSVSKSNFAAGNTLEKGRAALDVSGHGSISRIKLTVTARSANAVYFRGFAWEDTEGVEHACASSDVYLTDKYGVGFDMTSNGRLTYSNRQNPTTTGRYDINVDRGFNSLFFRDEDRIHNANRDFFWMNINRIGYWGEFSFDAEYKRDSADNMEAIGVYVTRPDDLPSDKANEKYYYRYYATFTDEDGHVATTPETVSDKLGYRELISIEVPQESDKAESMGRIANATICIRNCGNSSPDKTDNVLRVSAFAWKPSSSDEFVKIPFTSIYSEDGGTEKPVTKLVKTDESKVKGQEIDIVPEGTEETYSDPIKLTKSDPLSNEAETDKKKFNPDYDDKDKNPGWEDSERINFFKEFDPKFHDFIYGDGQNGYKKLKAPTWINKENTQGRYKFLWNRIKGAAAYEVRLSIVSQAGNAAAVERAAMEISRVSAGRVALSGYDEVVFTYYDIESVKELIDSIWQDDWGTQKLKFSVRAISPYHLAHEDDSDADQYDSDWASAVFNANGVLPQPEVHLEFTGDNHVVAVLDNPEAYIGYEGLVKNITVNVGGYAHNYYDFVNKKTQETTSQVFIDFANGKVLSEPFEFYNGTVRGTVNTYSLKATAKSASGDIADSATYIRSGSYLFTTEHSMDGYSYAARFDGFSGETAKELSYNVKVVVYGVDFYVDGEFVAYDPKLGVPVAYSSGSLHTANMQNKHNTYFGITLDDLPEDIVGRDFMVRTYMSATQDHMMQLGHLVKEGVELNSEADVKALVDEKYIVGDTYTTRPIYGASGLNPGYTIRRNADGTYDIWYIASLECRETLGASDGSPYQVVIKDYSYSDYKNLTDPTLIAAAAGHDIYNTGEVGTYAENIYSSNVSNKYILYNFGIEGQGGNVKHEYTLELTTTGGEKYTFVYRDGEYYLRKPGGGIYGSARSGYEVDSTDIPDSKTAFEFWTQKDGSVDIYHRYQQSKYDYWHQFYIEKALAAAGIKAGNGNAKFTINDGKAKFEYYYTTASDPFADVSLKVTPFGSGLQLVQPAPVISGNMITGKKDGHDTYTFAWDQDAEDDDPLYQGGEYDVELVGTTISGNEVSIKSVTRLSDRTYTFTDDLDNWNYKSLRLMVTRRGLEKSGVTTILPHMSTSDEFTVTLKLDTVSIYGVSLNMDASGKFITEDLDYSVVWDDITDPYQREDLAGYIIKVVDVSGNAIPHYYPVDVGEHISFTPSDGGVVKAPLESGVYDEGINQYRALVDLSDFDGGMTLHVTVQAIAKTDAAIYSDGGVSNVFEIDLLTRLATPVIVDPDGLSSDRAELIAGGMAEYAAAHAQKTYTTLSGNSVTMDYDNAVTLEEYARGFVIGFDNTENYADEDPSTVTVNIAAAIYDEPEDGVTLTGSGSDITQHYKEDAPDGDDSGMYWNSGAEATLLTKAASTSMEGRANSATYNLDLTAFEEYPGQYAGRWIKLAFMTSKTNKVYSSWTDEDLDTKNTVNYYWIHIPDLVLDDVVAGDTLSLSGSYEVEKKVLYYNGSTLSETRQNDTDTVVEQVAFGFAADPNAGGYAFTLKQVYSGTSGIKTPVYGVYLVRNYERGGYDTYVKALNSDAKVKTSQKAGDPYPDDDSYNIPSCRIRSGAVWTGYIDDKADGKQTITLSDISHEWEGFDFAAQVSYDTESRAVRLVLPDLQKINSVPNLTGYMLTDSLLLQTWCPDKLPTLTGERDDPFIPGMRVLWSRTKSGDTYDGYSAVSYVTADEAKGWLSQALSLPEADVEDEIVTDAPEEEEPVEEPVEGDASVEEEEEVSGTEDIEEGIIDEQETIGDIDSTVSGNSAERTED